MATKLFERIPSQGYLGGVCAGLGKYTKIDPLIWRVLFATTIIPIPIYLLLWIFGKKNPFTSRDRSKTVGTRSQEEVDSLFYSQRAKKQTEKNKYNTDPHKQ